MRAHIMFGSKNCFYWQQADFSQLDQVGMAGDCAKYIFVYLCTGLS